MKSTCILLLTAAVLHAATSFPNTSAGRLGRELVDTINSGDAAHARIFAQKKISERGYKWVSAAEYTRLIQKTYAQSGGITIMAIAPLGSSRLRIDVQDRTGKHRARMDLTIDSDEPDKLLGFNIYAAEKSNDALDLPSTAVGTAEVVKAIDRFVRGRCGRDEFSGTVIVAKDDKVAYQQACGLANKEFNSANNVKTRYNIGSMGKMFTAVAIGQLVEKGKLSFDDTLAKLLPAYPNRRTAEKIKVRHLLTHTSGLTDVFTPEYYAHRELYITPSSMFPLFANDALLFEPGERYSYSNAAFVVLGAIIEQVTGSSYFDYIRDHIFRPADMTNTGYYELTEIVPNRAIGYMRAELDPFGMEPMRSNLAVLSFKGTPAGGAFASASDLLRFARALRECRLASQAMTETLTSGKVRTGRGEQKYGYGFLSSPAGPKEVRGHGGGGRNSGVSSELQMIWQGPYTVVVASNYDFPSATQVAERLAAFLARQ